MREEYVTNLKSELGGGVRDELKSVHVVYELTSVATS